MLRIVLPSLSNAFISLFKDTSLASVIAVPELTYGANWIKTNTFRVIEVWVVVTPMYLVTGYALLYALRQVERRFAVRPMSLALQSLPFLWQGLLVTLHVSALVVVLSLAAGLVLGVALAFGPRWLLLADPRMYSDIMRGMPLLVLIFFVYYVLPVFRIEPEQLLGGGLRARRLQDRPRRRDHARRDAVDPPRPDRRRPRHRPDLRAAARST